MFLNILILYCENSYPFKFTSRQYTIKLPFEMTINKYKGQAFYQIYIDLRKDV